jgi:phage/plasmid-associated DNA primase
MRQDFFEFEATQSSGGQEPQARHRGYRSAIWRRIHLLPFTVNLQEKLQDNVAEGLLRH